MLHYGCDSWGFLSALHNAKGNAKHVPFLAMHLLTFSV